MNTTEILNKSIAWFNFKEKGAAVDSRNVSDFLTSPDNYAPSQLLDLEFTGGSEFTNYFSYEVQNTFESLVNRTGIQQVAPQEVHILTQVILNTLNTEPERFHDMTEIPGFESKGWSHLGDVALLLIKQGWIEAKATATGFLIKLTIEGKVYLKSINAWA